MRILRSACAVAPLVCAACTYTWTRDGRETEDDTATGSLTSTSGGGGEGGADGNAQTNGSTNTTGTTETTGTVFEGEWVDVTANLEGMESECGNMSYLSAKPDEDRLIAGIAARGLWESRNGGESWEAAATSEDSEEIINRPTAIVYDPKDLTQFWLSGIYNGFGIFKTEDNGETYAHLGDIGHNDYVSIDFTDPDRRLLLASGHESRQVLYRSEDGGETWEDIGENLSDEAGNSSYPYIIDSDTYLIGMLSNFSERPGGIWRSEDGGETWEAAITELGGYQAPLRASDGTLYWASEYNRGIVSSTDDGESWEHIVDFGVTYSVAPLELPDGRIASIGNQGVMIYSKDDDSWTVVSPPPPWDPVGIVYSVHQRAFFLWHFDCNLVVPEHAISRYDFDYEKD